MIKDFKSYGGCYDGRKFTNKDMASAFNKVFKACGAEDYHENIKKYEL